MTGDSRGRAAGRAFAPDHVLAIGRGLGIIALAQLMGVLAKLVLFDVRPFTFVWLQLATAIVFMVGYTFGLRREGWPRGLTAVQWAAIALVGAVNFGACRLLMMLGIERLPMNTFVFLLSFVSLATLGLSVVFLGERPGRIQLVGVVLAIVGVRFFFREVPPPDELIGVVYAGCVVLGLAASNNVTRWLMGHGDGRLSARLYSTIALLIGGVPLVLAGLLTDPDPEIGSLRNGAIIVANGVIGIALAQTVFNGILRTLRSFEASVVANSGLVFTALLAIPILGEWLELRQVVAIVVLMGGVLLAQWRPAAAAAEA